MSEHTPGSWSIWPNPNGGELGIITDNALARHIAYMTGGTSETKANARLIAAAPELLEALRAVIEDHEERIITTQMPQEQPHRVLVMDNARTAIAKAEGIEA